MESVLRLTPHLYLFTPLGPAEAHFISVSSTFEVSVLYGCFICETKENWWFPNTIIRLAESISAQRGSTHSEIHISDDLFDELKLHILRHKKSPFYDRASQRKVLKPCR